MSGNLTAQELRNRFASIWPGQPPDADWYREGQEPALRISRAISWVGRAEKETQDPYAKFIFYWIAFNAAYGKLIPHRRNNPNPPGFLRRQYFENVAGSNTRIADLIWGCLSGSIEDILSDRYVLDGFHDYYNQQNFLGTFMNHRNSRNIRAVSRILRSLFGKLCSLRNKIVHGEYSWNNPANLNQIKSGLNIVACLVPQYIDAMMTNRNPGIWGHPWYPRIKRIRPAPIIPVPEPAPTRLISTDLREQYTNSDVHISHIPSAISWVERAENEDDDSDARFIFYWIAFNAAYEIESSNDQLTKINSYIRRIVSYDDDNTIYRTVLHAYYRTAQSLIDNEYIFQPFWDFHNRIRGNDNWQSRFLRESEVFHRALANENATVVLSKLFGRLYVIRKQLVHGGSTWGSSISEGQVACGAEILSTFVPAMVDLEMKNTI